MGFRSKATVTKSRSIARVVAPPAQQIFSPSAPATLTLTGQTPPDFLAAWRPSSPATLTLTGQTPSFFRMNALPGFVAEYDGLNIVGSEGAGIAAWPDSGGTYNLAQATGSLQPIYHSSLIGGQPGATFDGSDDFLFSTFPDFSDSYTVYLVASLTSGGDTSQGLFEVSNGSAATGFAMFHAATIKWRCVRDNGSVVDVGATDCRNSVGRVFTATNDGTNVTLYINGTQDATTATYVSPNPNTLNRVDLGRIIAAGWTINGSICYAAFFNTNHGSADRASALLYLRTKYSI